VSQENAHVGRSNLLEEHGPVDTERFVPVFFVKAVLVLAQDRDTQSAVISFGPEFFQQFRARIMQLLTLLEQLVVDLGFLERRNFRCVAEVVLQLQKVG
jgi:hypothetical protein